MADVRKKQLTTLLSHIRSEPWTVDTSIENDGCIAADVSFIVGDFNLDPSYPENALVQENGFDLWDVLQPNDAGYTEDTNINKMRLYSHGKHKQARYDRVLLVPRTAGETTCAKCRPYSIDLLGDKPFDEELWPSDHFGLVTRVGLCKDEIVGVL